MFLFLLLAGATKAANFTAIASGNWSSSLTWGGTAPSFTNSGDNIIIPATITVTMDNNVTMGGALAAMDVEGKLQGSATTYMTVTTGTVSGAGTIASGYVQFGEGAVLLFSGAITTDYYSNSALLLKTTGTVTVNKAMTLSAGVLSLEQGSSVSLASSAMIILSGGTVTSNGGSLVLSSTYNVQYTSASTIAGLELTGSGLNNVEVAVPSSSTVTLNGDLTVKGALTLTSGVLVLGSHNLTIAGDVAATGAGTVTSTSSSITFNGSSSTTGTLNFSGTINTVNNLKVALGGTNHAAIGGNVIIASTLTLASGDLNLAGSTNLTIQGDIASTSGKIAPSPTSNITIATAIATTGTLTFENGNNTINNLTINIANAGNAKIGSALTVAGALTLTNGKIDMGSNTLTLSSTSTVSGGSSSSYVITGANGYVSMALTAGTTMAMYQIGTTDTYFPAMAMLASGSSNGNVMVNASANVLTHGTTGNMLSATAPVVNATWDIKSDIASNMNLSIGLMWAASAEVNGFDRTNAYISHYTNGAWDATASASATTTSNGMYSMSRSNITSLSPFAVVGKNATTGIEVASLTADNRFGLYPNPAKDVLTITNNAAGIAGATHAEIINIEGKTLNTYELNGNNTSIDVSALQNGCYFIKLFDNNSISTVKFIKE